MFACFYDRKVYKTCNIYETSILYFCGNLTSIVELFMKITSECRKVIHKRERGALRPASFTRHIAGRDGLIPAPSESPSKPSGPCLGNSQREKFTWRVNLYVVILLIERKMINLFSVSLTNITLYQWVHD